MKSLVLILVGIIFGLLISNFYSPQRVSGTPVVEAVDVPVDEIPTRAVGPLTSLTVSPDAKAPVNRLQFTAKDATGVVYRGSPEQLAGLIQAVDANIFDLRQKRAELVNIQTSITAEITKQGLTDPLGTTTP